MKKNIRFVTTIGCLLAGALLMPLSSQAQTALWAMNETGATPIAVDTSGNGWNGTTYGNVYGGASSLSGTAFSGFTSNSSNMIAKIYASDAWPNGFTTTDWSFITYIKNPDYSSGGAFVARGSAAASGSGGSVPWQISINEDGSMTLYTQSGGAVRQSYTSDALSWNANSWYQIAITADYTAGTPVFDDLNIYVTEVQQGATISTPVISETVNLGTYGLATANYIVLGGADNGYYSADAPGGYFGGEMDQTSFWRGTILSTSDLNNSMVSFIPENESYAGVCGLVGLGLVLLRRRLR